MNQANGKSRIETRCGFWIQYQGLELCNVYSTKFLAVLRILLCLEGNFLTLFKSLVAFTYDCGEVYENIIATVVVGNEAIAFLCIEPLNCTVVHTGTSMKK